MIELWKVGRVTRHSTSHTLYLVFHLGHCRKMGLAASETLIHSDLPGLNLISKGKVRDIYETSDPNRLLFVASDRISAYDVIMKNVRAPHTPPGARRMNKLLRSGRSWKGSNLDTDFDSLVQQATTYHSYSFLHREH